jgi:hypothetical protein
MATSPPSFSTDARACLTGGRVEKSLDSNGHPGDRHSLNEVFAIVRVEAFADRDKTAHRIDEGMEIEEHLSFG